MQELLTALLFSIPALAPQPVDAPWWTERHAQYVEQARDSRAKVAFFGDSITDLWRGDGRAVWDRELAPLGAANFGIGGDRVENVLWRIQNGEAAGSLQRVARVAVLLIGTNNLAFHEVEEIAATHSQVIDELRARMPGTRLLVLAVFPRQAEWSAPFEAKIAPLNARLREQSEARAVRFLDIGDRFLSPEGLIPSEIMYDGLHLTAKGYRLWADAMLPVLRELLQDPGTPPLPR